jgi:hypothetical protein
MAKTQAAAPQEGIIARRPIVEEFLVATRPLLKLLRGDKPLTQNEEDLIAAKIGALRVEFPKWKKYAHKDAPVGLLMPPLGLTLARAEKLIIAEWHKWAKKRGSYTITDLQIFYFAWLPENKPKLLSFRCPGDQWQVVRGWIQKDEALQVKLRKFCV